MQGIKRKLVYVTIYEIIAIGVSGAALALLYGIAPTHAGALSILASVIAVLWNLGYNALFEYWESRRARRGRDLGRRLLHAIGFEFGLVAMLVPIFAALLGVSLWQAFVLDLGMILFFLVYTFLFNLIFDRLFGLPSSALPVNQAG